MEEYEEEEDEEEEIADADDEEEEEVVAGEGDEEEEEVVAGEEEAGNFSIYSWKATSEIGMRTEPYCKQTTRPLKYFTNERGSCVRVGMYLLICPGCFTCSTFSCFSPHTSSNSFLSAGIDIETRSARLASCCARTVKRPWFAPM